MSNYPKYKKIYERISPKEKYLYSYDDGSMDTTAIKEFCINYTLKNYLGKESKTVCPNCGSTDWKLIEKQDYKDDYVAVCNSCQFTWIPD